MSKIFKSNIDGIFMFFCSACGNCHWFSITGRTPVKPDQTDGPK